MFFPSTYISVSRISIVFPLLIFFPFLSSSSGMFVLEVYFSSIKNFHICFISFLALPLGLVWNAFQTWCNRNLPHKLSYYLFPLTFCDPVSFHPHAYSSSARLSSITSLRCLLVRTECFHVIRTPTPGCFFPVRFYLDSPFIFVTLARWLSSLLTCSINCNAFILSAATNHKN